LRKFVKYSKVIMLFDFIKRNKQQDFVVIDSIFPQKEPYAFRNSEINEYFKKIKNFSSYTMYPMLPDSDAWFSHGYGMSFNDFADNKKNYLNFYPDNKDRILFLEEEKKYNFKLAYSFFLAETYTLLPFYEKNKVPFVFVLYPGGAFGIDFNESDKMLEKIFKSDYFSGVIVTQLITKDYLLTKKMCPDNKIFYIYGGFVQFNKNELGKKQLYKKDKNTFDICFVANKYSLGGIDKGYDLFIETAKMLCQKTTDIMFHVIGDFKSTEIDVSKINKRIKFYGIQKPTFLKEFYKKIDIFLSPNRPFSLFKGNFDGFPLGIDPIFCGVAGFVSDELGMNNHYVDGKDIIIIKNNSNKIANKILFYYKNLRKLYKLSKEGLNLTQKLFDIDYQIDERIKVFRKFVKIDLLN